MHVLHPKRTHVFQVGACFTPQNETSGTVDIAGIISQLKNDCYITTADTGILDVEYGIEGTLWWRPDVQCVQRHR